MKSRQLTSTITHDRHLQLGLREVDLPEPKEGEVVIRVEAAPINPSDLGPMFGPADMGTARSSGAGSDVAITADIPASAMPVVQGRIGVRMPMGNEGAGVVVGAGSSTEAQALLGKTVATLGGAMYAEYKLAPAEGCLVLPEGTTPAEGASCFVNPLTVLGMVETMRLEGHHALVHTAAASNLGQMLVRLCLAEGVPLVNVVRRQEHVELLRGIGATHVVDSSSGDFMASLVDAVAATDATIAFDATGGGRLASDLLTAMETAQSRKLGGVVGNYGSSVHKQVYIYGSLDRSPTELVRAYGMAWGVGGWLLTPFLQRVGPDAVRQLRQRVPAEIKTTFASSYTAAVSLEEALTLEAVGAYGRRATGEKYLIAPHKVGSAEGSR